MTYTVTAEPTERIRRATYKASPSHIPNLEKPFVGWDGEGYSTPDGEHHYMLFGNSLGEYVSGKALTYKECFDLLLYSASHTVANHVIYAGGYDMVMMLKGMPVKVQQRILAGKPKRYKGYRIEYFKSKYLKLGDGKRNIILYDVFSFFQTSFVKACREYLGGDDTLDAIAKTKTLRNTFTLKSLEKEVIPYWKLELEYLVKLMDSLREKFSNAGIPLSQWHGPGAVATAVLKQKGINAFRAVQPEEVREAARHAYYGGRFEQFKIGYAPGPVYQYDIRSAYPSAIALLPSLAGLRWAHGGPGYSRFHPYGLYRISIRPTNPRILRHMPGPVPWRDKDKSIYYPNEVFDSWYWGIELHNLNPKLWEWEVSEWWEPASPLIDFPFGWVKDLYAERAKMKAEGNPSQLAVKLALNSLYGKLAQGKGAKLDEDGNWKLPAFHQIEWAGWVTAATRHKLYQAMMTAGPKHLIAVETDAVYSTRELKGLRLSTELGDWERDISSGILYLQSGVYFKQENNEEWRQKSRGFEKGTMSFEEWQAAMARMPSENVTVTRTMRRFGTVPGTDNFARWYEQDRSIGLMDNHMSKRMHSPLFCDECLTGHPRSYAECLHQLAIPYGMFPSKSVSSTPHPLPWIDEATTPYKVEWVIPDHDIGVTFDFLN